MFMLYLSTILLAILPVASSSLKPYSKKDIVGQRRPTRVALASFVIGPGLQSHHHFIPSIVACARKPISRQRSHLLAARCPKPQVRWLEIGCRFERTACPHRMAHRDGGTYGQDPLIASKKILGGFRAVSSHQKGLYLVKLEATPYNDLDPYHLGLNLDGAASHRCTPSYPRQA